MLSLLFAVAPLAACFGLLCTWMYCVAFNHRLITAYQPHAIGPSDINNYIRSANTRLGCHLELVDVDPAPAAAAAAPATPTRLHIAVGLLFSVTAALAVELVGVLLGQLVGVLDVPVSVLRPALRVLVVLVTVVVPAAVVWLVSHGRSRARALVGAALYGGWFVVLRQMGAVAGARGASFVECRTNEIVVMGITITAVLLGAGSVLTPHGVWGARARARGRSGAAGAGRSGAAGAGRSGAGADEARVNRTIRLYNAARALCRKREAAARPAGRPPLGRRAALGVPRLLRKVRALSPFARNTADEFAAEVGAAELAAELAAEIAALRSLTDSIYSDVAALVHTYVEHARPGRWPVARAAAAANTAFAAYCVYRVANVMLVRLPYHWWAAHGTLDDILPSNVIDDPADSLNKHTKDALALSVAKLLQSAGYRPLSEPQLVNQVGFILSGLLFVCLFQNVLVTFRSVAHLLPRAAVRSDTKAWLKSLVVCELLGVYVIATALLIRSNLPPDTQAHLLQLLLLSAAGVSVRGMQRELDFIDFWFDKVFGFTCIVAAVVLALRAPQADDCDEECFIEDGLKQT